MENFLRNPYIEKKTNNIYRLKQEILMLPINNYTELRLRNHSLLSSVYYSLFLSGVDSYIGDVEKLIQGSEPVKMDPEKAIAYLNYKKIVQYIHSYYNKSTAQLSHQFVCNINKTLFLNSKSSIISGSYRTQALVEARTQVDPVEIEHEMETLYEYIEGVEGYDPLIKAAIFYIRFMKISPFMVGNGRTARALTLLFLFKNGYSLGGFLSPEQYMTAQRGRKYQAVLKEAIDCDNEDAMLPFTKFFLLSINESATWLLRVIKNTDLLDDDVLKPFNDRQKKLLMYLKDHGTITLSDYLAFVYSDVSQAGRDFEKLRDLGFIEKKGMGRSTYYLLRKTI